MKSLFVILNVFIINVNAKSVYSLKPVSCNSIADFFPP